MADLEAKKKSSQNIVLALIGVLLLVGIAFFGMRFYVENTNYVTADNARIAGDLYPVVAKAGGKVVEVDAKVGDKVHKNDTLVKFEQSPGATIPGATDLKAPEDGTVIQVNTNAGVTATPGIPLVYVANMSKITVTAYVLESDIDKVKPGEQAKIKVDAYPGETFTGKVKVVGLATASQFSIFDTSNATGNYSKVSQRIPVTIELDNSKGKNLILGLSASVKILVLDI